MLAFWFHLGFLGLSLGLLGAQVACALFAVYVIRDMDWEGEALKTVDLVGTMQAMMCNEMYVMYAYVILSWGL